jgi:hypothetical protein
MERIFNKKVPFGADGRGFTLLFPALLWTFASLHPPLGVRALRFFTGLNPTCFSGEPGIYAAKAAVFRF